MRANALSVGADGQVILVTENGHLVIYGIDGQLIVDHSLPEYVQKPRHAVFSSTSGTFVVSHSSIDGAMHRSVVYSSVRNASHNLLAMWDHTVSSSSTRSRWCNSGGGNISRRCCCRVTEWVSWSSTSSPHVCMSAAATAVFTGLGICRSHNTAGCLWLTVAVTVSCCSTTNYDSAMSCCHQNAMMSNSLGGSVLYQRLAFWL